MRGFVIFISLLAIAQSPVMSGFKHKIERDEYLVIPGVGAENVLLGQGIKELHKSYAKSPLRISRPEKISDIFRDIYRISGGNKIYFDRIFFYDERGAALFVKDGLVQAVAGLSNMRVTIDSIDMSEGARNFVSGYGKKGLSINKSGKNISFFYWNRGIAVFDDGGDDVLDMYLIFRPLQ